MGKGHGRARDTRPAEVEVGAAARGYERPHARSEGSDADVVIQGRRRLKPLVLVLLLAPRQARPDALRLLAVGW